MLTRYELQNIIRGNEPSWKGEVIQAITCHLGREKGSIQANPESKQFRIEEEEEILRKFIDAKTLWLPEPDELCFIGLSRTIFLFCLFLGFAYFATCHSYSGFLESVSSFSVTNICLFISISAMVMVMQNSGSDQYDYLKTMG